MNRYELLLALKEGLPKEGVEELVKAGGGELLRVDDWGQRRLAYKIGNAAEGQFHLLELKLPPEKVAGFKESLRLNDKVLRFLLTRPVNLTKGGGGR